MNRETILQENEYKSNKLAAKVMLITTIFIMMVYGLNVVGIFVVPHGLMTVAMVLATIVLVLPFCIVYIFKQQGWWVKYVIVTCASLLVGILI